MSIELQNGGMPTVAMIIKALAEHFDAPEAAAIVWLQAIHQHFDAKAANEALAARGGDL